MSYCEVYETQDGSFRRSFNKLYIFNVKDDKRSQTKRIMECNMIRDKITNITNSLTFDTTFSKNITFDSGMYNEFSDTLIWETTTDNTTTYGYDPLWGTQHPFDIDKDKILPNEVIEISKILDELHRLGNKVKDNIPEEIKKVPMKDILKKLGKIEIESEDDEDLREIL